MTWFNPMIFNRENLKNKDRLELDYWYDTFLNVIEQTVLEQDEEPLMFKTLDKIKTEIEEGFAERMKENLKHTMQEQLIGCISNYEEYVEERDEYTDYFTWLPEEWKTP